MAEKIIKKTITPSEQGMLDRTKAPPGKLEGLFSSNEIKKYNQCHGPNGRFCSGGGGGGGGGGGSYEPMNIPQGGLQTGAQVKPATSVDEALGKPKSEHLEDILSDSEKKAFAIYNGPDYQMINNYLRYPQYRKPENEEWAPVIARMDSGFAKAPPMQYPAVVYRGLDYNSVPEFKGKSGKDLVGAVLTDKGYMSTSHDRALADRWGNTVLTIRVPKGTKAIEMQDLIDSPRVRNEKELLLNRDTRVKITHVREEKGFLGRVNKRYIEAMVVGVEKSMDALEKVAVEHFPDDHPRTDRFVDDGKGLIVEFPMVTKEVIHPENSTTIDEASNINAVCSIFKADDEKRLVYGIVLVPNVEDLQGDIVYAEEIEAAAHDYMRNSRTVFKGHKAKTDAEVVESYIAPVDIPMGSQIIPAGSWIMVTKVHDDAVWEMVKKGELTGYSIGGTGERHNL